MARKIVVCDAETDPFRAHRVPRPFVWGYYDGTVYKQFPAHPKDVASSTQTFIEFLREQPVICYAHNGGKFDWHFLLDHLTAYDDIMIINGRIAKANFGLCEARDSFNILPVPLSAYKKDDIDYTIMEAGEREKPHNWQKISEYLKSDCIYLYELVSRFIEQYGVQLTQAGASMAQWKKISKRKVPRTKKLFYDDLSPYYYGGRVECFKRGIIDKPFSVYDINSAYPFAMLQDHPYSKGYDHVEKYVPGADFYKISCISRGAFPYRGLGGSDSNVGDVSNSVGGFGLRFPADAERRTYTVTKWEYQAALDTQTISHPRVLESIYFTEKVNFSEYVNYFYTERLKAIAAKDDALSLFCKLLMNSLYGKFASNPENYRNYMICPMDVIAGLESQGWNFAGELGPWALADAPLTEEQQRFYNVATGASITGFVRAMLWRAICSSKGVIYCDTDSVAVKTKGKSIILGDALGQWKSEGEFDRAGVAGKKLYIFRGVADSSGKRAYKTASKGARLTHAQLWAVARGGEVDYVPQAPTFSHVKGPHFVSRRLKFTA